MQPRNRTRRGERNMLRVLGSPLNLHGHCTRREWLQVGALGALGLGLAALPARAAAGKRLPHFGRAKSCILLYLYGAHSQLETFDPKPDAPVEARGELRAIPSSLPGM